MCFERYFNANPHNLNCHSGPGSAPNEIVALPMPGQGINVEWTTPDDVNGKIDNYVIQYGEIAEGISLLPFISISYISLRRE